MERNHLRRLPVVDHESRLVGLLSLTDVAREGARSHARATKEMIDCRVGEVVEALTVPCDSHEIDATR
jgi:CBS-domain-containing membrane protein